jgi:diketogulonate reductase-like aldo/keto reductase
VRTVALPDGTEVRALGLGTWNLGEKDSRGPEIVAALRLGLDLGMSLIDTAEMYADGGAEEVVGAAIEGRRDEVFLVSKVYPRNATRKAMATACERSLKRLRTDRLDLYLLHWRESVPLAETVEGFETLRKDGKIRRWGVSNFDVGDMEELWRLGAGQGCATDLVLYNLSRRWPERDLLPWCREHDLPIMAYSPIEQGRLLGKSAIKRLAKARGVSPAQIALAWLLRRDDVIVIPKASSADHIRDNRAALDLVLAPEELAALDRAFPAPHKPARLETL